MHYLERIKQYFYPRTILDIGANVGQFYLYANSIFDKSYIFCIEGNEQCEIYLRKLTRNYKICLLTKTPGEYEFYENKNNPTATGNSIYKEISEYYDDDRLIITKKQGIPLDTLISRPFMFDLIKIDTQGSELDIMQGGINVCSRAMGILLEVSVEPYNENAPLKTEVMEYMNNIGFSVTETLEYLQNNTTGKTIQETILFLNNRYFNN